MSAVFEEMAEQNYKILISDIEEGVLHVVTFLDFAFGPRGPCPSKKHFLQKSAAICSPQGRHTVAECQTNENSLRRWKVAYWIPRDQPLKGPVWNTGVRLVVYILVLEPICT